MNDCPKCAGLQEKYDLVVEGARTTLEGVVDMIDRLRLVVREAQKVGTISPGLKAALAGLMPADLGRKK